MVMLCYKAAGQMQQLEEECINAMRDALSKYNSHLSVIGPKLVQVCHQFAVVTMMFGFS